MRDRVRFVLVTDDIDFVLADVFASARSNAPTFVRITDDPIEILALPDRCKVHHAVWTSSRERRSGAELAWMDRRSRGDLVFLSDAEMQKVAEWRARRAGQHVPESQPAVTLAASTPAIASLPIQQWT